MGLAGIAGNADEITSRNATDQFGPGIETIGDLADEATGQPLFGGALVANADIGMAAADIDLVAGGDQFQREAIARGPDAGNVAGEKGRGPGTGRYPHHPLADGAVLPALQ